MAHTHGTHGRISAVPGHKIAQNCSVHYLLLSSLLSSLLSFLLSWPSRPKQQIYNSTSYRPGGGETICPPPMAVRLAAGLRPHTAKLQAASVPIA